LVHALSRVLVGLVAVLAAALLVAACRPTVAPGWTFTPVAAVASPRPTPSPYPTPTPSPAPVATTPVPSAVPTTPPVAHGPDRLAVPILYYHRVIAPPSGFRRWTPERRQRFLRYDVVPAAFEAQLDWLVAHGYTTILPRDLAAAWDRGVPLPERPVIITFDDGTHDWAATVLPLLRERGMVAEFYVTLASLKSGGMSWPELRALAAAGNGIGAHGLHHVQLAGFGTSRPAFTEARMRTEVEASRDLLAAKLGVVPDSYSYVGGGFDSTLKRLVFEAGYTTARSIVRGRSQDVSRRFVLRVIRIGSKLDVRDVTRGTLVAGLPGFTRLMLGPDARP
jgi:peptidoglycan/xylan/chitin deacetylase (PgdA/CDA1 family)